MMPRSQIILASIAAAFVVFAVLLTTYFIARTPRDVISGPAAAVSPAAHGETVHYTVKKDATAGDIGNDLQRLGVIASGAQFQLLVAVMGLQDRLSAGDYDLPKNSSAAFAIDAISVKDSVPTLKVTFPEGIRLEEMADLAAKAGFGSAQDFIAATQAAQLPTALQGVIPEGQGLQGYLFPDTYIMPVGSTPAQLVKLMLDTFVLRFGPDLRAQAEAHGLTIHQAVTLASIVEREAQLPSERPLIAGVFMNRIKAGDILGADPTVQFAVAEDPASVEQYGWWKQELTVDDLKKASPYNTYLNAGFPPGPITNPGLAALQAAANPETTDYYYFVADAKKADGSHLFAKTAEEHEQNKVLAAAP